MYLPIYWVGLMDGDGSIQVNHRRYKNLQFRLEIKLKNLPSNFDMLNQIASNIGGKVYIQKEFVLWVVNNKNHIIKIIKIFDKYPPLTTRLTHQLNFLKSYIYKENLDINLFLFERKNKYLNPISSIQSPPIYFPQWLSGFIEAESCFCIRENKSNSFRISKLNDLYIIEFIKDYFKLTNKIRSIKSKNGILYLIETYKKASHKLIMKHCEKYPLLGNKNLQYQKFIKK